MKERNLFLSTITTGSNLDSVVLNLSLVPEDDNLKSLYIERLDFDINKLIYNEDKELFNAMKFNELAYVENESDRTIFFKGHDIDIRLSVTKYFNYILNEEEDVVINIYTDNPVDWIYFINTVFNKQGNGIQIPEFINPYPIDIYTYLRTMGIDYDEIYEDYMNVNNEEIDYTKTISVLLASLSKIIINNVNEYLLKDE